MVDNGPRRMSSALLLLALFLLFHFEMASEGIVRRRDADAVTGASLLSELINEESRGQ